ncbi:MAG: potassium channel family protein [Candidatus Omnitrophota bacterium]
MKFSSLIFANKFGMPLFVLLFWLIAEPFLPASIQLYWGYGYFFILLTALYHINASKKPFFLYFLAASAIVLLHFLDLKTAFITTKQIRIVIEILFCMAAAINIIWYTADFKSNIEDGLWGAILGFIILAGCFASIYYGICNFEPSISHFSFMSKNLIHPLGTGSIPSVEDLLYLSFITITTCGYGDIYPISAIAKRLCSIEACTGSLYLAIFVGRLFAVYQNRKNNE